MNGTPRPRENTRSSSIPWATVSRVAAMVRTPPRIVPMQGDHPKPKATPITGGAQAPRREGRTSTRRSRARTPKMPRLV